MEASGPSIHMTGVHKRYVLDGVEVHALRGIELTVVAGEFVAITGPSGSGKSTLMNVIGCLDRPDSGDYQLDGVDVARLEPAELASLRNHKLGFVFQGFNLLPRTSALENVETPLIYAGIDRKQRVRLSLELLDRVGLGDRVQHLPSQLSGGQQQRVAVARALVNRPSLLLADEPTGNLDTVTGGEILDLLTELNEREHLTIVLITHEAEVANRASRRLVLRDGVLSEPS